MDFDLIETNSNVLGGKPVFKDTRIPVAKILQMLGKGILQEEVFEHYPALTSQHITQAFGYSSRILDFQEISQVHA